METMINEWAQKIEKRIYKTVLWVQRNVELEKFSPEDMRHNIVATIYETVYDNPELSGKELFDKALSNCRRWYIGKNSMCYDRRRRETPSTNRSKYINDLFDKKFGVLVQKDEVDRAGLFKIYNDLSKVLGHEIATVYVLHIGYKIPRRRILDRLLGFDANHPQLLLQEKRLDRLIQYATRVLNQYVSRESRELFNFDE